MPTKITIPYEVPTTCPRCGQSTRGSAVNWRTECGEFIVDLHCVLCNAVARLKPDGVWITPAGSTTIQ